MAAGGDGVDGMASMDGKVETARGGSPTADARTSATDAACDAAIHAARNAVSAALAPHPVPLSRQLADILARPVAETDRRRAFRHLSYWTGAAARVAAADMGEPLWQAASLGLPVTSTTDTAHFLFEASLGSLDELDDTHRAALVHPGPVVIPVVRHLARVLGASAAQMADAIVRGYDAAIRVGLSVGPAHYVHWHTTATCGGFGAAAAAASMFGLDAAATAQALSLAATRASGLWQIRLEPSDGKPWHTSQASQLGLAAAAMARAGLRGPAHALEGEKGFFKVMCPDAQPGRLVADPQGAWRIHETSFKPWPACRHAHPAIAAALAARATFGAGRLASPGAPPSANPAAPSPATGAIPSSASPAVTPSPIAAIDVQTYPDAIAFCNAPSPADLQQARFSLQHAVAITLLRGDPGFDAFEAGARQDPDVASLRARVRLAVSPALALAYPAHFGARLVITLADGTVHTFDAPDAPGDPECPLSDTELDTLIASLLHAGAWSAEAIRLHQAGYQDLCATTGALRGLNDGATLAAPLRGHG
jgi:2-methylcitrate dehydratase PrpD